MQTFIIFPVKVFIFRYYAMMDNTPAKKCQKLPKNRHIRPPFSLFYLRKCLTNSDSYISSQRTEENSNAICSLGKSYTKVKDASQNEAAPVNIPISEHGENMHA